MDIVKKKKCLKSYQKKNKWVAQTPLPTRLERYPVTQYRFPVKPDRSAAGNDAESERSEHPSAVLRQNKLLFLLTPDTLQVTLCYDQKFQS